MASASDKEREDRKWRTSLISPFAANAQLILYQCGEKNYKVASKVFLVMYSFHKVKLMWNEAEVIIPGCEDNLYCDWDVFKAATKDARNFEFDKVCGVDPCVGYLAF